MDIDTTSNFSLEELETNLRTLNSALLNDLREITFIGKHPGVHVARKSTLSARIVQNKKKIDETIKEIILSERDCQKIQS